MNEIGIWLSKLKIPMAGQKIFTFFFRKKMVMKNPNGKK